VALIAPGLSQLRGEMLPIHSTHWIEIVPESKAAVDGFATAGSAARLGAPIVGSGGDPMSDPTQGLARYFFQVSYVVRDMKAAHEWLGRVMGVEYFGSAELDMGEAMNLRVRGKPAHCRIHFSLGRLGADGRQEIEVIQPITTDSIYQEFLDAKGPGIHHVGFLVPDYSQAAKPFLEAGMAPIMEGETGDGGHFAYFDCGNIWGSMVELVHLGAGGAAAMEQLKTPPK
jgi:hypothetical protein